jgi:hypothetical protein
MVARIRLSVFSRHALWEKQQESRGETMIRKTMYQVIVVAGVLALCSMFAGKASAEPVSQQVTVTGYISCTTCLMPNACKNQTRLSCTQSWMGRGASYVLVVGDRHYVLSGLEIELAKAAAASSVTVTGELNGTELVVASVDTTHKEK